MAAATYITYELTNLSDLELLVIQMDLEEQDYERLDVVQGNFAVFMKRLGMDNPDMANYMDADECPPQFR